MMSHDSTDSGVSNDSGDSGRDSRHGSTSSLFDSEIDHDVEIDEMTEKPSGSCSFFTDVPASVWYVYIHLMTVVIASTCSGPVMVLYFNMRYWTTKDDVLFYTICTFVGTLLPVLLNPVFGFWQGRRSTKELFIFDSLATGYGYLMMAVTSERWVFFVGYCLSRLSLCQRATRVTYIVRTTSAAVRTQAVAMIPLFALSGALLGPLLSMLCSLSGWWEVQGLLFNPYTLTFYFSSALSFVRIPMMVWGFSEEVFSDRSKSDENTSAEDQLSKKRQHSIVWQWFFFFALLDTLGNGSLGIYTLTLQPILVNLYSFDQTQIALVILALAVCTMIPPLIMGILSKKFQVGDRWFLATGAIGLCIGLAVYAVPPGTPTTTIVGVLLSFPFSALFGPASNSLFSKIVGTENASGMKMGLLASAASLGQAVGSVIGGQTALPMYGKPVFSVWLIPVAVCVPLILLAWVKLVPSAAQVSIVSINESRQTLDEHRRLLAGTDGGEEATADHSNF